MVRKTKACRHKFCVFRQGPCPAARPIPRPGVSGVRRRAFLRPPCPAHFPPGIVKKAPFRMRRPHPSFWGISPKSADPRDRMLRLRGEPDRLAACFSTARAPSEPPAVLERDGNVLPLAQPHGFPSSSSPDILPAGRPSPPALSVPSMSPSHGPLLLLWPHSFQGVLLYIRANSRYPPLFPRHIPGQADSFPCPPLHPFPGSVQTFHIPDGLGPVSFLRYSMGGMAPPMKNPTRFFQKFSFSSLFLVC